MTGLKREASSTAMNKNNIKRRSSHVNRPPHCQQGVKNVQITRFARSTFKLLLSFEECSGSGCIFHHLVYVSPRQCPTTQLFQGCDAQRNCCNQTILSISFLMAMNCGVGENRIVGQPPCMPTCFPSSC